MTPRSLERQRGIRVGAGAAGALADAGTQRSRAFRPQLACRRHRSGQTPFQREADGAAHTFFRAHSDLIILGLVLRRIDGWGSHRL